MENPAPEVTTNPNPPTLAPAPVTQDFQPLSPLPIPQPAPVVETPVLTQVVTPALETVTPVSAPVTPVPAAATETPAAVKPPSKHEKIWITVLHLSVLAGVGLIIPLLFYVFKKHGATVNEHALEASNFHLSILIYGLIIGLLAVLIIGLPLLVVLIGIVIVGWLWAAVCSIFATFHGVKGKSFHYPLTMRLIK